MTSTLDIEHHRVLADRYELGALIGAGGAARVYAATDRHLERTVAVKVLDDAAARSADPAARERFLLESRTAARFDHPNLVTVYDAGVDDGVLYLVMEHVAGATLAEHVATHGALAPGSAAAIAGQVAEGLAAAHECGVLHRDVKPANILVEPSGRALLADFGIAKRLDDIEDALTSDGTVIGTPAFLAPEQATAGTLTAATDVYALGMVLHEMLTGWRPRGSAAASAWRNAPFDPRTRRADVPDALAAIVLRATDPDPARRFASAADMAAALAAAAVNAPSPSVPPPASVASVSSTRTLHAAPSRAASTGAATAVLPPATTVDDERRPVGVAALLITAAVLCAGLVVFAQRDGMTSSVTTPEPPPTTVAAVAGTVVPAAIAPVTAAPAPTTAAPAAEAPPPAGPDTDGSGKPKKDKPKPPGHGRGRGRGG